MTSQASPLDLQQQLSETKDLLRDIVALVRQGKMGQDLDQKLAQAQQLLDNDLGRNAQHGKPEQHTARSGRRP